jgi:hypothetical protein
MHINDPLTCGPAPSSARVFGSKSSSTSSRCSQCAEYSSRISDLEACLTLAKRQAQMAVSKASKACGLTKQMSILDDKVSSLTAKIVHHEECESFILGIVESACEMLRCKFPFAFSFPCFVIAVFVTSFAVIGTCLDFAADDRQVTERNAALEKMSACFETLWSDPRHRSAIVLLQDRAQHIGESVDGCRRAFTTMHSVMLPRNPLPATFPLLLDTFRSSHRIHRLIELNLVAGANFALGWIRKWHPRLNYSSMSLSLAPGGASLQVHMESTLQPARRLVARLLEADAVFFDNPLL